MVLQHQSQIKAAAMTTPGPLLSLRHVFGLASDASSNMHYLDESVFLYPAGGQVVVYNAESRSQRFIHTPEAASAMAVASGENGISALAVSPKDHKFVAVAERGEHATVSVYNVHTLKKVRTSLSSSDCASKQFVYVAFSSDQRFLLTQGGAPDYTLVNWLWEKARPLQMAKLATGVNVRITVAMFQPSDPSTVVVAGTNLVKVLHCEQNEFKQTPVVLKAKKDAIEFQCMTWDGDRCLIGADNGEVYVVEGVEHRRTYCTPKEANSIHAIAMYAKGFVVGCDDGLVHFFERIDDKSGHAADTSDATASEREWYRPLKTFRIASSVSRVIAIDVSPSGETMVCTLDNAQAYIMNLSQVDILKTDDVTFELLANEFHSGAITGLDICTRKPLIATSSFDGTIRIWNYEDNTGVVSKNFEEPPLSIAFHPSGLQVVVGFADRLTLMSVLMDEVKPYKDLPLKDCRECAFSNGGQYFAVVSGTTISVYLTYTAENIVNLRGHTGKIRSIAWNADDTGLVSGGMNGTIIEWDLRSGSRIQEFEQKNCTFTSVAITNDRHLYAVGNDSVVREIVQGAVKAAIDLNIVMTRVAVKSSGTPRLLFVGASTGAVRVFKLPLTNTFQSFSIHSGAITSLKMSPDETTLFAAGEDGTISVIEIRDGRDGLTLKRDKRELPWAEEVLVSKVDLEERMAMMKELAEKVDELTLHNEYQTRLKEMNYQEQIRALNEKYNNELKAEKQKLQMLMEEKEALDTRYHQKLADLRARDETAVKELGVMQEKRIRAEKERYRELQAMFTGQQQRREKELADRQKAFALELQELEDDYQAQIEAVRVNAQKIEKEKLAIIEEFEETKGIVEKDADQEIDELKDSYDAKLAAEKKMTLSLAGNNGVLKAKFAKMQSRIKKQKEQIEAMVEDERKLYEVIRGLEKDIEGYEKEISERGSTIADKDKRINDLRKKNQELEKFKFVLDYKIRELNRQIQPRELEIERKKKQLDEMDGEVRKYRADYEDLTLKVKELKLRLAGLTTELDQQVASNKEKRNEVREFAREMRALAGGSGKELKKKVVALFHAYNGEKVATDAVPGSNAHNEHQRQRVYLERMIDSMKHKQEKDAQLHKLAKSKSIQETVSLVAEINELRRDIDYCEQQMQQVAPGDLQKQVRAQETELAALQTQLRQLLNVSMGTPSAPMDEFTPRPDPVQ